MSTVPDSCLAEIRLDRCSVIVAVTGDLAQLEATLTSLGNQTCPPLEVIIVGPLQRDQLNQSDRLAARLRILPDSFADIRTAWNQGLALAVGEFVLFIAPGICLVLDALERAQALLDEHPAAAFAYGHFRCVDTGGRVVATPRQANAGGALGLRAYLETGVLGVHATTFYRRAALGGPFRGPLNRYAHLEMQVRLLSRYSAVRMTGLTAEEVRARDHSTSLDVDWPELRDCFQQSGADVGILATDYTRWMLARILEAAKVSGMRPASAVALLKVFSQLPGQTTSLIWRELRARRKRILLRRGSVNFGSLDRTTPIGANFGFDRGLPIDRRYIETFLADQASLVQGRVLEVGDSSYTRQFGGARVSRSEVLHIDPSAIGVDYVADLATGESLPSDAFDCVICTQTLHLIYDMPAAVRTLRRILRPGGCLLLTVPGVSSVDAAEWGGDMWLWSLTVPSLSRLLKENFGPATLEIVSMGNTYAAAAFLYGLAVEDVDVRKLAVTDAKYPVIVAAKAIKAS